MKRELQEISRTQLINLEKLFQDRLNNYFYNQEKHIVQMFSEMSSILENKKNAQPDKETGSMLSLPQFEERMGCWNEDFKKQLEKLHKEHMAEIKRLQVNMSKYSSSNSLIARYQNMPAYCSPVLPLTNNNDSESVKTRVNKTNSDKDSNLQRNESFGFTDLGSSHFNTKSLFARPVFSPVATVLPQRKQIQRVSEENKTKSEKIIFAEVKPVQTKSRSKKKRKKKKYIYSQKKKKPNHKPELNKNISTTPLLQDNITDRTRSKSASLLDKKSSEESGAVNHMAMTKQQNLSVYDFNGDEDDVNLQPKVIKQNKTYDNNPGNRF